MFTRTATASDLPDIADIASKCFMDDELFSFITPYRHKFPLDFRNSFLRRLRTRFWTPGFTINVAVLEAGDKTAEGEGRRDEGQAEGKIVGCAVWDRIGEDDAAQRWKNKGWTGSIETFLLSLEARYVSTLHLDRSLDHNNLAICSKALDDDVDNIASMWRLRSLCTDLPYQRRGIGSMLIAWGKERATEDGVPIGLSSSMEGQGLYLKEGFRLYKTVKIEGFPIGEVPVLLWEPPGLEGQWGSEKDKKIIVEEGLVA